MADVSDEDNTDCSDEFYLLASTEAPSVGDADGPYVMVTSPAEGDSAEAGEEYTVEVREGISFPGRWMIGSHAHASDSSMVGGLVGVTM